MPEVPIMHEDMQCALLAGAPGGHRCEALALQLIHHLGMGQVEVAEEHSSQQAKKILTGFCPRFNLLNLFR